MAQMSSMYRLERNMQERHRRRHMKYLLQRLAPLIHPDPSKLTVFELVDHAICFVKKMEERIEKLRQMREEAQSKVERRRSSSSRVPVINIKYNDSIMEVNLATGTMMYFILFEVLLVFQEQGAEVMSCSHHTVGDAVHFTIVSQAIDPSIGVGILSNLEKLMEVVF